MQQAMTTSSVARLLGISEASVRTLERDGRLPAVRTESGLRIFSREAVEKFAEARAGRHGQRRRGQ